MNQLPMRPFTLLLLIAAYCMSGMLTNGCGYSFPHVYQGPEQIIYMPNWRNRTNKLALDSRIHQSLSHWFQKTAAITLTKDKTRARYILAGEIISIDLPSVAWEDVSRAAGVNVKLHLRYVLKDLHSGAILWEIPSKLYTADYTAREVNPSAEEEALEEIIADLSEHIYLGVLHALRKQQSKS